MQLLEKLEDEYEKHIKHDYSKPKDEKYSFTFNSLKLFTL